MAKMFRPRSPPAALFVAYSQPKVTNFIEFLLQNMAIVPPRYLYAIDPGWLTRDGPQGPALTFDTLIGHSSGRPGSTKLTLPKPLEWTRETEMIKHTRGAPCRFEVGQTNDSQVPTSQDNTPRSDTSMYPYLGVMMDTPSLDSAATIQPVSAISYDARVPPEEQQNPMGLMKDAGSLSIPRSAIKAWWPEGSDSGFDSWRSLALAAQLAHPVPATRCDIVVSGAGPDGQAQQEVVAFLEDPSDRSSDAAEDGALERVFALKWPKSLGKRTGEEKEEEEDDATAARELCGLVRSAVSLRLHVGGAVVEAPILILESQAHASSTYFAAALLLSAGGSLINFFGHQ